MKISLHPLFIVILLCSIFTGYFIEIILLFIFVFVHEVGHYFMAKHFNWKIKEIKLLPFGGVLIVDDAQATTAFEESFVALAGPLQNVIIMLLAWFCGQCHWLSYDWVEYIIRSNLWLMIFNLLPIHPLDGGKLLQALVSISLPYFYTMKIMIWVSIVGASLMIIVAVTYGLWKNNAGPQLNLLLVGSFLFLDNLMRLKNLPYLLYRFILQRRKALDTLSHRQLNDKIIPIVIHEQDTLLSLFKKIKRESNHLFYYASSKSNRVEVKVEQELLEKFSHGKHLNRALIDIFD